MTDPIGRLKSVNIRFRKMFGSTGKTCGETINLKLKTTKSEAQKGKFAEWRMENFLNVVLLYLVIINVSISSFYYSG